MRTVMLVTATLTSAKLTVTAEASTPVAVANSSRQVCLRDEMPESLLLLKGSHAVHVSVITSVSVEDGGGGGTGAGGAGGGLGGRGRAGGGSGGVALRQEYSCVSVQRNSPSGECQAYSCCRKPLRKPSCDGTVPLRLFRRRSLQEGHRSGRRGEGRIKGHGGKSKAGAAASQAALLPKPCNYPPTQTDEGWRGAEVCGRLTSTTWR